MCFCRATLQHLHPGRHLLLRCHDHTHPTAHVRATASTHAVAEFGMMFLYRNLVVVWELCGRQRDFLFFTEHPKPAELSPTLPHCPLTHSFTWPCDRCLPLTIRGDGPTRTVLTLRGGQQGRFPFWVSTHGLALHSIGLARAPPSTAPTELLCTKGKHRLR